MKKEMISLAVLPRDKKLKANVIRKAGKVPGVVYGSTKESLAIECSAKDLQSVYVKAGENTLVEVELEKKKLPCLIHAVSFEPVSGKLEHVDFYAVDMTKKVTAHVPVVVKGESPAVKTLGGVLLTVHDSLEVSCLPADLPENFAIDISVLENFHESITVAKIAVPKGVTIKSSPETVIVTVQEPRKEEEVVAPVAAATAEGAVPAEGGAAAPAAPGAPAAAATPAAKADDKAAKAAPAKK